MVINNLLYSVRLCFVDTTKSIRSLSKIFKENTDKFMMKMLDYQLSILNDRSISNVTAYLIHFLVFIRIQWIGTGSHAYEKTMSSIVSYPIFYEYRNVQS